MARTVAKATGKPQSGKTASTSAKAVKNPASKPATLAAPKASKVPKAAKPAKPALSADGGNPPMAKPASTDPVDLPAMPAARKDKVRKTKLVRDSFTMPEAEYQVLGEVKKACIKAGFEIRKSELLRIGVTLIRNLDAAQLRQALDGLTPLKPGRPKKEK